MPTLTTTARIHFDHAFPVPFDRIHAADVEPAMAELLAAARARLAAIAAEPGQRTFANTMVALDAMTEPLDYAMGVVRHLESVATTPELRAAFNAVQPAVSAFYSGIPLDAGLWRGVKAYAATAESARARGRAAALSDKTVEISGGTARTSTRRARSAWRRSTSS